MTMRWAPCSVTVVGYQPTMVARLSRGRFGGVRPILHIEQVDDHAGVTVTLSNASSKRMLQCLGLRTNRDFGTIAEIAEFVGAAERAIEAPRLDSLQRETLIDLIAMAKRAEAAGLYHMSAY